MLMDSPSARPLTLISSELTVIIALSSSINCLLFALVYTLRRLINWRRLIDDRLLMVLLDEVDRRLSINPIQ